MNTYTKFRLIIGSLFFILANISIFGYFAIKLLFKGESLELETYTQILGISGITFILGALSLFLLRCPVCSNKMFNLPWKRTENNASPTKQIVNGLIHKKWECGSCGKIFYNANFR